MNKREAVELEIRHALHKKKPNNESSSHSNVLEVPTNTKPEVNETYEDIIQEVISEIQMEPEIFEAQIVQHSFNLERSRLRDHIGTFRATSNSPIGFPYDRKETQSTQ